MNMTTAVPYQNYTSQSAYTSAPAAYSQQLGMTMPGATLPQTNSLFQAQPEFPIDLFDSPNCLPSQLYGRTCGAGDWCQQSARLYVHRCWIYGRLGPWLWRVWQVLQLRQNIFRHRKDSPKTSKSILTLS